MKSPRLLAISTCLGLFVACGDDPQPSGMTGDDTTGSDGTDDGGPGGVEEGSGPSGGTSGEGSSTEGDGTTSGEQSTTGDATGDTTDDGSTGKDPDTGSTEDTGGGSTSGGSETGSTESGSTESGSSDSGSTDSGDSSSSGEESSSEGGGGPGYVPNIINAAITKQLSPLDLDQPAIIELGTLSRFPIQLENGDVEVPDGWHVISVEEDLGGRDCPTSNDRCRQYWMLSMLPAGACTFNGSYVWNFDIGCAPDGDCDRIDPTFTTWSVTSNHTSENFCGFYEVDPDFPAFYPKAGMMKPTTGTDPVSFRLFTSVNRPYLFEEGIVEPPEGFTFLSMTEEIGSRNCGDERCQQWWIVELDPGSECRTTGTYHVTWDVTCDLEGGCNPAIEEWSGKLSLVENRDLCQ